MSTSAIWKTVSKEPLVAIPAPDHGAHAIEIDVRSPLLILECSASSILFAAQYPSCVAFPSLPETDVKEQANLRS